MLPLAPDRLTSFHRTMGVGLLLLTKFSTARFNDFGYLALIFVIFFYRNRGAIKRFCETFQWQRYLKRSAGYIDAEISNLTP